MLPITGYTDRLSATPGETLEFKISTLSPGPFDAQLVKVICGDVNPAGPGLKEQPVESPMNGTYEGVNQPVNLGSYATVADTGILASLSSFTLRAVIWPTTPSKSNQGIISRLASDGSGFALTLDGSKGISVTVADNATGRQVLSVDKSLRARQWYEVWASYDANNARLEVGQRPLQDEALVDDEGSQSSACDIQANHEHDAPLLIAALGPTEIHGHFNGKIEAPAIYPSGQYSEEYTEPPLASWDFALDISSIDIRDESQNQLHGELVNLPARGMMGSTWDGREMCWRHAPEQYNAIHFHDDDLYDCNWRTTFSLDIPVQLASGVYAVRVRQGQHEDMLPFFVRPATGTRTSSVCLLIPTFTYVIYANHARGNTDETYHRRANEWGARTWTPDEHPEYGLSTYNFHSDGSGVCHSSRLRPMMTMRSGYMSIPELPGSGLRHFPADTHIIDWLEAMGHDYDVITDDDLHTHGRQLIEGYSVVITGSHPEYHTPETLDALTSYTHAGGRLMYMGGNGFYWRVAKHPCCDGVLEIRRAEGGIRAWAAEPGEYYNAFDGAYGGMWRRNNRPPQQLAGVGFSAQGLFESSYYRRQPGAEDARVAWIFDGVTDEILGDFGLCGGGAAGYELDRADPRLGSPQNLVVLASSENHAESFVLVPEEQLTHVSTWSGEPIESLIRADMSYFETPAGGEVFSTGSITFCGSLSHNQYDNNISKIVDNVLRRFKRPR